jgi:Tol biopolymer transport system component
MNKRAALLSAVVGLVAVVAAVHPSAAAGPSGRIAFSVWNKEAFALYVADADGRHRTRVPGYHAFDVEHSPDGSQVAFAGYPSRTSTQRALMTVRRDGTHRQVLLSTPGWVRSPSWSPDGHQIVYAESVDVPTNGLQAPFAVGHWGKRCRLEVLDLRTGEVRTLLEGGGDASAGDFLGNWAGVTVGCPVSPKWSPRGDVIAFVADLEPYAGVSAAGAYSSTGVGPVMTIRPDGTGLRPLTGTRSLMGLDFSPDGARLAYGWAQKLEEATTLQLRTVGVDGSDDRLVADLGPDTEVGFPAWSPDGRSILAQLEDYNATGFAQLYRFPASGGRGIPVVTGRTHYVIPDWHR